MIQIIAMMAVLPAAGAESGDAGAAVRKSADAAGFAFHSTVQRQGESGMVAGEGVRVEGRYHKGRPLHLVVKGTEFFLQQDLCVYKDGADWHRHKTGQIASPPLRVLDAMGPALQTKPPHEELHEMEKLVASAKRTDKPGAGAPDFTAELSAEALKKFAVPALRGTEKSGEIRLWTAAGGEVVKYQIVLRAKGEGGPPAGSDRKDPSWRIDCTLTRTVELSEIGTAKVEVPDAVTALLEK